MKTPTAPAPLSISETPDSISMQVHNVGLLAVSGGRFAQIHYGLSGELSVRLNQEDAVASLFESSEAEFEAARAAMRRGMRIRCAAWKLSQERNATPVTTASTAA